MKMIGYRRGKKLYIPNFCVCFWEYNEDDLKEDAEAIRRFMRRLKVVNGRC